MSSPLIQINLSSENEAKRKTRPQQSKLSNIIGLSVAVILVFIAIFYFYATLKNQKTTQLRNNFKSIEEKYIEAEKLEKLYNKLNVKFNALNNCKSRRINLAEKWLELAKLTPDNIYITEISFLPLDKEANNFNMIIKARAVNTVDESLVLKYLDNIKKSTFFTNTFNTITLSAVYSDANEKVFSIQMSQKIKKKQ